MLPTQKLARADPDHHSRNTSRVSHDGRLWTRLSDVRDEFVPVAGQYAVVGCDDAEPAVAQIISADVERGITLQVLDGTIEEHRHLLPST